MSFTLWFIGLPGSGKTTLSLKIFEKLIKEGNKVERLDSDDFVHYLNDYFHGTAHSREINSRCMTIVSRFLNLHNIICIAASGSPLQKKREANQRIIGNYIEVYCKCPLEILKERDPKGLYKLAMKGIIKGFTGVDEEFEEPLSPDIIVNTNLDTIDKCCELIMDYLTIYIGKLSKENKEYKCD